MSEVAPVEHFLPDRPLPFGLASAGGLDPLAAATAAAEGKLLSGRGDGAAWERALAAAGGEARVAALREAVTLVGGGVGESARLQGWCA